MRAVDTNVLVRLLARDDPEQAHAAEDFVAAGAWVSHLVLVETVWVLDAVFKRNAVQIAAAVEMLLDHSALAIQDSDVVAAALECFRQRPGLGFSYCLVVEVARKAGQLPVGTFDRNLAKLDGVTQIREQEDRG
jgi:predicted nucleic-acid-binding protein